MTRFSDPSPNQPLIPMSNLTRREFLKGTLTASAAGLAMGLPACTHMNSAASRSQVRGANSALRVAVVGVNSRGKEHLKSLSKLPGVRVVALCDADERVLGAQAGEQEKKVNRIVRTYVDYRRVLDRNDIDAVSIATPNHWHSLMTVWACQAGKDVYVEKPVSHNVFEGRQSVEAAKKYDRVVQAGTQCRSSRGLIEAVAWVQAGNLGKINLARGLCYKPRWSIGKTAGPRPIPSSVDYDLWCGPAPKGPLMRKKLHYDWHWVWDTGNGDLGNQGVHQVDIARWVLGESGLAPRVFSVGGRHGYIDDGQTPNTQVVIHDYAKAPLIFEVRGLETGPYLGAKIGVVVECEGGWLLIPDYETAYAYDRDWNEVKRFKGGGDHFANWVEGVRSRSTGGLRGPIEEGHVSSALCHLANVSHRLGSQQPPQVIAEKIQGNKAAAETFERMTRHLADNDVDLHDSPATLGEVLVVDAATERFTGGTADAEKANTMLTRDYRKPFVVPQVV